MQLSPEERQNDIIKKLLFESKILTYEALSAYYNVSKSSLQNDFKVIRKKYPSTIVSNPKGTKIIGNEADIRSLLIYYNTMQVLDNECRESLDTWIKVLSDIYGKQYVDACLCVIDTFADAGILVVADRYVCNLLNILTVIIYRVSKNHHLTYSKQDLIVNEIMDMPSLLLAKDILMKIEQKLAIEADENDYTYLAKYLIANRIQFQYKSQEVNPELYGIIQHIIKKMGMYLELEFHDDGELFDALAAHMKSMLYRLQNGIFIKNSLLSDIKSEFRVVFDLLLLVMKEEFDALHLQLTEDEIGFLLIYFQSAIDKKKRSKRVLVVCPMGISTSQLVVNRIRNILPPMDIVEAVAIDTMLDSNIDQIDFVISTVPLTYNDKPVLVVSPLITESDIRNIAVFYHDNFILNKEVETKKRYEHLLSYLPETLIEIRDDLTSKEDIINFMCQRLEAQGYVSATYRDSILERELIGSTDLHSGAAIPHGNLRDVNTTSVAIYITNKSVKWNEHNVKVVVFLQIKVADRQHAKAILQDIFSLVRYKDNINILSNFKTIDSIIHFLKGGSND